MRMSLTVIPTGRTTATVILDQAQVDAIRGTAGMARVPLAITYKGSVHRTSVSRYRGEWMMVVNQQMRDGGLAPGGTYTVDIAVDSQPREVELPDDLQAALAQSNLTAAWDALSYTRRKEHVRSVTDAKKPETRAKRVLKVVESLGGAATSP